VADTKERGDSHATRGALVSGIIVKLWLF
jgi:hypothetical protein